MNRDERRDDSAGRRSPLAGISGSWDARGVLSGGTQSLAYAEIALGLAVLVTASLLFFPEDPGFLTVAPHPFWVVVLAIAARYGALPGYAAGVASAAVYLALAVWQAGSFAEADLLSARVLAEPVLFLLVGASLGELREARKREHLRLARRYDELEENVRDLAQRYLASMELSRELERRIVTQTATVTTLYGAAKALEGLEVEELEPAVLELVASFIEADACSLYLRREGRFVLAASLPARSGRPEELDTSRGLPAVVMAGKRAATVREIVAEVSPMEFRRQRILMAAPLLSEDREVMGLLVVEKMPFLRFTPTAVRLFALLADWASSAFQRALRFRQTRDRNIEDELTGAYSYAYTTKRIEEEFLRARRYGLPLALLAVRVAGHGEIEPVKLPGVLRVLSLVFRHNIRSFDVLGKHSSEDTFLLLLTHTTPDGARSVAARLEREVAAFGFRPFDDDRELRIVAGLASLSEDVSSPDDLVQRTADALAYETSGRRGEKA